MKIQLKVEGLNLSYQVFEVFSIFLIIPVYLLHLVREVKIYERPQLNNPVLLPDKNGLLRKFASRCLLP
jgi:hypothetical protein